MLPVSRQTTFFFFLCLFMLNRFIPDLSSVLDTDHILPVGCKDEKKSSYPQVSVRLPPTSQPLIKTKITNNNNYNKKKIKRWEKCGKTKQNQESEDWVRISCTTGWSESCMSISVPHSYTEDKWWELLDG